MTKKEATRIKEKFRTAVADYMSSEGCWCCANVESHEEHKKILAEMLEVHKYKDGSGYDFKRFKTRDI